MSAGDPKVKVTLYAAVGQGPLLKLIDIEVPVYSNVNGDGLEIPMKRQMDRIRDAMRYWSPTDEDLKGVDTDE